MDTRFDYVIVGAGSAGCVLANRLSAERGCTVALLEAGGPDRNPGIHVPAAFPRLFATRYDWNYHTVSQATLVNRSLYWPRGRTLGGCSSINAQVWTRGHRSDYDEWGKTSPGWTSRDVTPYFERAEGHTGGPQANGHSTHGPVPITRLRDANETTTAFLDACHQVGIDRQDDLVWSETDTCAHTPVTQRRGRRASAVDAYLRPARRRRNLVVLPHAQVLSVSFRGTTATGVTYRDSAHRTHHLTANAQVILAAGAVNTPQLLMLSGIGAPDQLTAIGVTPRHDLPGVGEGLQDHLATAALVHCRHPVTLAAATSARQVTQYLLLRRGMLSSNIAEALAFIRSDPTLIAPDLELLWAPVPFAGHGRRPGPPQHGLTLAVILLRPNSRGRIRLASADPTVPPLIDPGYLSDPTDLPRLVTGLRTAQRVLRSPALGEYVGPPLSPWTGGNDDDHLARYVRASAETLYHPVGTCRMGEDPESVVDPQLRVHGLQKLRIVDASVMPTIPRAHTHAPTTMIAERAADLILQPDRPANDARSWSRSQ